MSPYQDKTNQSEHESDDFNDPNPEVDSNVIFPEVDSNNKADFNDSIGDDDEGHYADPDRMLFMESLVPVGNSFALVYKKSNGKTTFLMFEGLSDGEDSCNDLIESEEFGKIQGSTSLSENVGSSDLDKKRQNDQDRGANTRNADSIDLSHINVSPSRNKNPTVITDQVVRGLLETSRFDQLSQNVSLSRNQGPTVLIKVGNDDRSTREGKVARDLGKKHKNDQDHRSQTRKVDSSNGRGLRKKQKNDEGNGTERQSTSIVEAQGNQGNGSKKERSGGKMEAQGNRVNGAENERTSVKIEAQDDQDHGDSNRTNSIWLNECSEKEYDVDDGDVEISLNSDLEVLECDVGDGDLEICSNSDLEVLDKDPCCSEWAYSPVAYSKMGDDDDDVQYIGERRKPENLQYRKDVEDILRRPYDKEEYDTLWLQVNSRKPQEGCKELRGGRSISYAKDTMGKSYLDEYIDLQRVLDTFQTDLPQKLNILRGFFFYLKKMATEGIFKPWLDESCLAIVPGTQSRISKF